MQIKLITYNIWHGNFLEKVIDCLRCEKADIVCLQEVATCGRAFTVSKENILTKIQEALGMDAVYAPMYTIETPKGEFDAGVAILSKQKIIGSTIIPYAGGFRKFQLAEKWRYGWPSVVLMAKIESLGVMVATTHLPVTHKTKVTQRQLAAAREVKAGLENQEELILCGDMNTLPGSGTYRILSEGLIDVSNLTAPTLHNTIHVVGKKNYHVDYVFYKGTKIRPLSTRILNVDGSDHLPIEVRWEVNDAGIA